MSDNWKRQRIERGFPSACKKCGAAVEIFTSKTTKNPWRLFHGCPNGSEEDKNHLFKWTDESVVEEIDDMKSLYDDKIGHLELQSQKYEDVESKPEFRLLADLVPELVMANLVPELRFVMADLVPELYLAMAVSSSLDKSSSAC
ncbi:uncharacterized protein At4g04775-like [Brassica napus]|uniref:uncharacterized protein At4g04775-like n=1 Tax=Brassica napus TaxID=3708 RepID=UPI0006AB1CF8|nr:uncharacterized protein At4g04775-like [Brassica napus]